MLDAELEESFSILWSNKNLDEMDIAGNKEGGYAEAGPVRSLGFIQRFPAADEMLGYLPI